MATFNNPQMDGNVIWAPSGYLLNMSQVVELEAPNFGNSRFNIRMASNRRHSFRFDNNQQMIQCHRHIYQRMV